MTQEDTGESVEAVVETVGATTGDVVEQLASSKFDELEAAEAEEKKPSDDVVHEAAKIDEKEKEAPKDDKKEASKDDKPKEETKGDDDSKEKDDEVKAPHSWNKKDKEAFAKAPKEIQDIIAKRESERDKKLVDTGMDLDKTRRALEKVSKATETLAEEAKALKTSPEQLAKNLAEMNKLSRENPVAFVSQYAGANVYGLIQGLIQAHNIDVVEMAKGNHNLAFDQEGAQQDVQQRQVQSENQALVNQVQQLTQQIQAITQQQELGGVERALSTLQAENDPQQFEAVRPYLQSATQMVEAELQHQGKTASDYEILKEAYNRVLWANPTFRNQQLDSMSSKKQQEQEAAVAASRAASFSPSGKKPAAGQVSDKLKGNKNDIISSVVDSYF